MIIGALFIIIQFGYYPWVPKFWVPNPHGYPRVIPKKTQNFELYGYPTRKYPWNSDTNPTQPIPKIWFGSGYYPWVPEFWVPNPHPIPQYAEAESTKQMEQTLRAKVKIFFKSENLKKCF